MYHRLLVGLLSSLLFLLVVHRVRGGSQPVDLDIFICKIATGIAGGPSPSDSRVEDWYDEQRGGASNTPESTLLPTREFEPNFGQTAREFPWLSRGDGFFLFLRSNGAVLDLRSAGGRPTALITVDFADANPAAAFDPANFRSLQHYLTGPDPEQWVTNVPVFDAVTFRDVYPGIDLAYYQRGGLLEHDWIVRPGGDARRIRLRFSSDTALRLNPAGDLLLTSGTATVRWAAPQSYVRASGRPVASRWRLEPGGEVSVEAASVSAHETLVIDPPIEYLSYAGRTGYDVSGRAVTDAQGNLYLTGLTSNAEWPASPGAPLRNPTGFAPTNAVVAKYSADGKNLLFSTVFGGTFIEAGIGIALDPQNNILLTGTTSSEDFPTTPNAVQRTPPPLGPSDPNVANCFAVKLNAAGDTPVFSTYIGGTGIESCHAVASDRQGNVYIAGLSNSNDFPTTPDVFQSRFRLPTSPGLSDIVVVKLNPTGSERLYSTFIGGSGQDIPFGLAVDNAGAAYLTGVTSSINFPVTAGAIRPTFSGRSVSNLSPVERGDAFVVKLAPDAASLAYSTYLGGNGDDIGYAIQVDAQGSAYVTGSTLSTNFPLTTGAYQSQFAGSGGMNFRAGDCFVSKLNAAGSQLVYSTLYGGSGDERCLALAVDPAGSAWVAGHTHSRNLPVTPDAPQSTNRTASNASGQVFTGDAFLAHFAPDGSRLNFATYLGGSGHDFITGLALSASSQPVAVGVTNSGDLAVTADAWQTINYGAPSSQAPLDELFITRFGGSSPVSIAAVVNAASYAQNRVTPGMIVTLAGTGIGPAQLTTGTFSGNRFATSVANTRVLFDSTPAPIIYVSGGQSSVVVPYDVAGKQSVEVVVERDGVRSAALTVPVVDAAPGLFSANSSGQGPGAILNQDNSLNTPQTPSAPGGVIILYGTGEGRVTNPPPDGSLAGQPLPAPVLPVRVTVAGRECNVLYAGAAPGLVAGLFQINAQLPPGIPSGNQAVVVTVGTAPSQNGLTVAVR